MILKLETQFGVFFCLSEAEVDAELDRLAEKYGEPVIGLVTQDELEEEE